MRDQARWCSIEVVYVGLFTSDDILQGHDKTLASFSIFYYERVGAGSSSELLRVPRVLRNDTRSRWTVSGMGRLQRTGEVLVSGFVTREELRRIWTTTFRGVVSGLRNHTPPPLRQGQRRHGSRSVTAGQGRAHRGGWGGNKDSVPSNGSHQ
jgi:hypothetical protein